MQFSVNTFAVETDPAALRFAALAQRRGLGGRLAAGVLAAVLLSTWIGPSMALTWAAVTIVWDALIVQRVYARIIFPTIETDPRRAERMAAVFCFFGSAIYTAGWVIALLQGGAAAGFLAGAWFGLTLIHGLAYFSNARLLFAACILPPAMAALAAPLVASASMGVLATEFVVIQALALLVVAANDRNNLLAGIAEESAARRSAEEASKAKSQFLANMSHELRTPLNAVIGYAEILEEDLDAEGRGANAADANRIRKAARHLLGLINEVLDLSKIEAGRMEATLAPTDVAQLVADAVEQARPAAEANGNTIVVSMPALDPVMADAGKLGQCLLNFLSNAAKFTENGRIDVRVAADNGVLRFDVSDTGCGIAPDEGARLFQPFTQVDGSLTRRAGGTGLGLAITRRLAEIMGGDVSFTSTPGEGSTFTLRVAAEGVANETGPTRPCVLVVEDEASARDLTRRALASLPFDVRMAATVADGLAAFRTLRPALVLLDIHLPDGTGWEVLEEVRRTRPETPVVVVSIDDDRARAMRLGAAEHMVKPVYREQVAALVLRLAVQARAAA